MGAYVPSVGTSTCTSFHRRLYLIEAAPAARRPFASENKGTVRSYSFKIGPMVRKELTNVRMYIHTTYVDTDRRANQVGNQVLKSEIRRRKQRILYPTGLDELSE